MIQKKKLLTTPFLHVYEERYRSADGNHILYFIETRPSSVLVVPMNEKKEWYITKEVRPILEDWLYSVPGGFVEEGETSEFAAYRELQEEAGLIPERMIRVNSMFPLPGLLKQKATIFLAVGPFTKVEQHLDSFEQIEGAWYAPDKVHAMLLEEERWDAQGLAALCMCQGHLSRT